MNELQQLLAAIEALGENADLNEIAELIAGYEGDLAELRTEITTATDTFVAGEVTDEVLATLELLGVAAAFVDEQLAAVAEADAAVQTRAQEIAAQIRGEQEGEPGEGGEGEPAEPAAPGEGEPAEPAEPGEGEPAEPEGAAEPIAASARRPAVGRVGRVAARRPAAAAPLPTLTAGARGDLPEDIADWGLVASANAPDVAAGSRITTRDQLAQAFLSAWEATKGYRHGPRVKVKIARAGNENVEQLYGPERTLTRDPGENHRRIEAVAGELAIMRAGGMEAVTAAGGICAPTPVRYDLPIVGTDERPVRDRALVRFGADRGGVRLLPGPLLEDLGGAIGVWTEENDQDPDDPAVKPCLTLTCPEDYENLVDAITKCLEVGNFRARFFPEQVEAWLRLAAINHARRAEVRLLDKMTAASTHVTQGQLLGTVPDILAGLDRATAIIESVNRIAPGFPMRFVFPFWLYNQMRTDEARRLPGGAADERYAVAEANLNRWMAARNVTPTPILDGPAGQIFGRQGDAPMQGWPSTVKTWLYPDGSHLFLDGGTLDLGLYRDSALVQTNDLQIFSETFEGHAFHGPESWDITFDTCPDGSISGTVDIDPCSTGS